MKKLIILLAISSTFLACSATKSSSDINVSNPKNESENNFVEADFTGQWTLSSVSIFADPNDIPQYKEGDYIWDFRNGENNKMVVTQKNKDQAGDMFALKEGEYQYWLKDCLIQIGRQVYLYSFDTPDNRAYDMPAGSKYNQSVFLYLDTSLEPSLADGGYELILRKLD